MLQLYTSWIQDQTTPTYHEDVVDGVQNDQDDFSVFDVQQVDDGLQSAALHQGDHLLHSAPTGKVGHCPHGFPLSLEVSLWLEMDGGVN